MNHFTSEPDPRLRALEPGDDIVQAFEVKPLGVRGRLVRFGGSVDGILHQHDYPAPVSTLLGEAVALTVLLGSALKFDGKFILQTQTDGPVSMLVSEYRTPGHMRGYAQFDAGGVTEAGSHDRSHGAGKLLGKGHLAMTVDQGERMDRYQGIVALDGGGLEEAAHGYFRQSEQIPTRLRLAAGPLLGRGAARSESWRAGAIMVQHLPRQGGASQMPLTSGDAPAGHEEVVVEDDRWVKARLLLDTVEDHELLDPTLLPAHLLYRLFHEDGVTVYPPHHVIRQCSCSRQRAQRILAHFGPEERGDMLEDGQIVVTCQFCSASYRFDPEEVG